MSHEWKWQNSRAAYGCTETSDSIQMAAFIFPIAATSWHSYRCVFHWLLVRSTYSAKIAFCHQSSLHFPKINSQFHHTMSVSEPLEFGFEFVVHIKWSFSFANLSIVCSTCEISSIRCVGVVDDGT